MSTIVSAPGDSWGLQVNFHGDVRAAGVRREDPPEGLYTVLVEKSSVGFGKTGGAIDQSKPYLRLECKIIGPAGSPALGLGFSDFINLPKGDQHNKTSEAFLKKTLVSLGHNAEAVNNLNGGTPLGPTAFNGKQGPCFFRPAANRDSFSETHWLSAEEAAKVASGDLKIAQPLPPKPVAGAAVAAQPVAAQPVAAFGGAPGLGTVAPVAAAPFGATPAPAPFGATPTPAPVASAVASFLG